MRKRRAKSFGTYLLYGGVCSREVLECATRNTAVYGGRLGTSLVELGALGIDEVGHHLAAFLGVPEVPGAWIEAPARDALSAVSRDLAEKLRVLPLRLEGRLLHVAMRNPCSASERDELGRSTGFGIQPYAVADLRLSALLEHYYGIPGELRVAEEASEESGSRPESESAAMDREGEELVDEETFAQLHTDWQRASLGKGAESEESFEPTPPIAVSAPAEEVDSEPGEAPVAPAGRADAAALEAELLHAPDRDAVARLALRLARIHVDAAALFVVRGRIVSGFRGDGEAIPEGIDGIMVPVDLESALTRVAALGEACRARPEAAMDQRILRALGREGVREVLVQPIRVRHHLVNLLYADAGSESLAETSVVALGVLCELVSRAYARLILERKKKHLA